MKGNYFISFFFFNFNGFFRFDYIPSVPLKYCSYPVRYNNSFFPLIDGEEFFTDLVQEVNKAKKSVWVLFS